MFRIDLDRMHVKWSDGDMDLALEFLKMEGYELATNTTSYRCVGGWEQRIYKTTVKRKATSESDKARRAAKAAAV